MLGYKCLQRRRHSFLVSGTCAEVTNRQEMQAIRFDPAPDLTPTQIERHDSTRTKKRLNGTPTGEAIV
jgi:hypothetical protein